jgi:glycosyltransferase involved in cell wall biosynthesis
MSRVSILMPTYKQEQFIERAIASLLAQELVDWELIIVDDGSPDGTEQRVVRFLTDGRISYYCLNENRGLGAALNAGLDLARSPYIAYLPSDDVYYAAHLHSLVECIEQHPHAGLVYAQVRHHYNRSAGGQIPGYPLQLVQVLHRRDGGRWLERRELVTDDLHRMFWHQMERRGPFINSGQLTCEWVDHPSQRHKIIREPVGGINPYRQYYDVKHPLRFHTSVGNFIDEVGQFQHYRERPPTPAAADGLKILLVGELAYNADRVLALEELGHQLYGLWMPQPYWYNWVGPLPFDHVIDIPRENWRERVRDLRPDVIYALLNWQAVPFAHEVLRNNPGIPFVWHFKEGPFICLERGTWDQMVELYRGADGLIYCSDEMKLWFETVAPGLNDSRPTLVLDGDLPKRDWFEGARSPLLSSRDGQVHTVVPGRPIGLHPHTVHALAEQGVHLHFYGDFTHGQWKEWIDKAQAVAQGYLHLHANVSQDGWLKEFSQYDAGWLHFFRSENDGEITRANWDDLNVPARMATLAVCGLPMLQGDNSGALVATQTLAQRHDLGLFFSDMAELGAQLRDTPRMVQLRESVWSQRYLFTFDHHAPGLARYFRAVIGSKQVVVP